ncbi:MAG: WecB/TagA/CpsF family glycosyltransferase [Deltaproteobacteria bacterium]|nr:WecB/TagA/CpsF family glycosyltransferase [Deltaproteobacteria bacterium]
MGDHRYILGMRVDATDYGHAAERITAWGREGASHYVCVANTHMAMESHDDDAFRRIVNAAGLVTPDGMPIVWGLRLLGVKGASRVYGPDLALSVMEAAAGEGLEIGFYGGGPGTLARLKIVMPERYPGLKIAYAESPPFRPLTPAEDAEAVDRINASGTRVLLVGLGCPKQEQWMAEHLGRVRAVMVGVGAAFDFLSGVKPQAPRWMMGAGLEWVFRLADEPGRLWRRYLWNNPRFVALFAMQLLGLRNRKEPPAVENRRRD